MSAPNLFLETCGLQPTARRPIWIMRQAGRYLPEYRAIRENASFREMVATPELCVEVTLQPIRRFGLDAAIIFSDILVILEALGAPYDIIEGRGPVLSETVRTWDDLKNLSTAPVTDGLEYVYAALQMTRQELSPEVALLGFAGAPWTLACYLAEGGSSRDGFPAIKTILEREPELYHAIMERLTHAVVGHLQAQLAAGADAVQVFDSWAGMLPEEQFRDFVLPYLHRIAEALQGERIIFYLKGAGHWLTAGESAPFPILSVDWTYSLDSYRQRFGDRIVLQGNLDPAILRRDPDTIRQETRAVLESHGPGPGHIFNLGHGITPDIPVEHVQAMIDAVRSYSLEEVA